jgi:hypothetical protein
MDNQTLNSTSLYDLMRSVILDEKLNADQKVKLIDELRKNNPSTSDRWTYRWAIWILGSAVLLTITFIYFLASVNGDIPESLIAIGSTVAGGIVGILSPGQSNNNNPV